jgi:hypothetical protein
MARALQYSARESVVAGAICDVWNGLFAVGPARTGCHSVRDPCRDFGPARRECRAGITSDRPGRRGPGSHPRGRPHTAAAGAWRVPVLSSDWREPGARPAHSARRGSRDDAGGSGPPSIGHARTGRDPASVPPVHGSRGARDTSRRDVDDPLLHGLPPRMGRVVGDCCSRSSHGAPIGRAE